MKHRGLLSGFPLGVEIGARLIHTLVAVRAKIVLPVPSAVQSHR
jgi:hypothetical protein